MADDPPHQPHQPKVKQETFPSEPATSEVATPIVEHRPAKRDRKTINQLPKKYSGKQSKTVEQLTLESMLDGDCEEMSPTSMPASVGKRTKHTDRRCSREGVDTEKTVVVSSKAILGNSHKDWACPLCTFSNPMKESKCGMCCKGDRPSGADRRAGGSGVVLPFPFPPQLTLFSTPCRRLLNSHNCNGGLCGLIFPKPSPFSRQKVSFHHPVRGGMRVSRQARPWHPKRWVSPRHQV